MSQFELIAGLVSVIAAFVAGVVVIPAIFMFRRKIREKEAEDKQLAEEKAKQGLPRLGTEQ